MKENKRQAKCKNCSTVDGLYFTLKNGERLPSYVIKIGDGIYCNPCAKAAA